MSAVECEVKRDDELCCFSFGRIKNFNEDIFFISLCFHVVLLCSAGGFICGKISPVNCYPAILNYLSQAVLLFLLYAILTMSCTVSVPLQQHAEFGIRVSLLVVKLVLLQVTCFDNCAVKKKSLGKSMSKGARLQPSKVI